ncbi:hypothetical protein MTR67_022813, partial [Solanum verrucosum]
GTGKLNLNGCLSGARRILVGGAIICCVFVMTVYVIWRERNMIRFRVDLYNMDRLSKEIAIHVHTRVPIGRSFGAAS